MKKGKDPIIFLHHILESISHIEIYSAGISKEQFFEDYQVQDAILRRVGIIGEAVKNIPSDFRKSHPEIPWKKIAGMRDVLIHEYFEIDLGQVWKTVSRDIPALKKQMMRLLRATK